MIVLWIISLLILLGIGTVISSSDWHDGRWFTILFILGCLAIVIMTLVIMGVQLWWAN